MFPVELGELLQLPFTDAIVRNSMLHAVAAALPSAIATLCQESAVRLWGTEGRAGLAMPCRIPLVQSLAWWLIQQVHRLGLHRSVAASSGEFGWAGSGSGVL
jgi:hypothetical protein